MSGLAMREVMIVVNRYIGVSGGYLGDFSYRTHSEFYPEYCDCEFDPDLHEGTTRERFIQILSTAPPDAQAKILRGVLERFPVEASEAPSTRTAELRAAIEQMADRAADAPRIATPSLDVQAESVQRALTDAEHLIAQSGATSAVDRVHTALHAYLRSVCDAAELAVPDDASLTALFKAIRQGHPSLAATGPRSGDIDRVLRSFSSVLDALNPLRNQASMAHPQPSLLEQPEAMLVVHVARTLLHYLDARLNTAANGAPSEAAQ